MLKNTSLYIQYKGFGIRFVNNEYRAESHSSPQFTETNLTMLKKLINNYLTT
jgi:hypothetical protein